MFGISVKITKCLDDTGWPSFVECEFTDAKGFVQIFRDKDAIFTTDNLDRNSSYPVDGVIGCEIVELLETKNPPTVRVDTRLPWGIESEDGDTVFEVSSELIIVFYHPSDSLPKVANGD